MTLPEIKTYAIALLMSALLFPAIAAAEPGSRETPLRVVFVPAETGAMSVRNDFKPVFDAITKVYGIHFHITLGDNYSTVVQDQCNGRADIALYGPVTFWQAHSLCGAELLAVEVQKQESVYYAGIYTRIDSGLEDVADLKGHSLAVGDPNSSSSFAFPLAMVLASGIEPEGNLSRLLIAGSHSKSLTALAEGRVDAAAASLNAWNKAIKTGLIDPTRFKVLAKSDPIPNPPFAMSRHLPETVKARLREAFNNIHQHVPAGTIIGYGGRKADRYDADYPFENMKAALKRLASITKDRRDAILKGASRL